MASLNPNLVNFWFDGEPKPENYIKARNRVLYGGRSSSKSWEYAGMAANIGAQCTTRFLCVRRFQNKIKDSVYTLIKNQISAFGLNSIYNVMASSIEADNGTEFSFYGIERNTDEIKSFEGADVLWIEEAHNLTKDQWEILEPTIRKEGSEIWISFNPKLITDFIYQKFIVNTPPNTIVRLVNYPDNQFLSQTILDVIHAKKEEDLDEYNHIYMGVPLQDDDNSVIKRSWIEAAIDYHINFNNTLNGARSVGFDVADSGADKNATALFDGAICTAIDEWKGLEDELNNSTRRAWATTANGRLIYDSIGVGANVGSTLKDMGVESVKYDKFNAGGEVINKKHLYAPGITNGEKFENLKAQAWQDVADRLRNTYNAVTKGTKFKPDELISISGTITQIERLKTELSTPRRSYSKRGLDMVETKDQLSKRGISSPNLADAFIMGACPHLVGSKAFVFAC
jgi:phage terminase large subunit